MALSTYAELQASIASHLNRDDMTSDIPDFITLTESDMNSRLRTWNMLTSAFITPASGLATLPSDFLEAQKVVLKSAPRRVLRQATTEFTDYYDGYQIASQACLYAVEGAGLRITPSDNTAIELTYYQTIPALADDNTSNWLLAKKPGAYLYGALIAATPWLGDDARLAIWGRLYENALSQLETEDCNRRFGQITRIPRNVM